MKSALIILSIWSFVCAIFCTGEHKSDKPQPVVVDTLIPEQLLLSDSEKIDTHWVSNKEMVLLQGKDTVEVFRKIGFDKTFKDHPVKLYKGKKAPLNYKSHRIAREYKTVITNQYKRERVNFAGHYIIAHWRCGAPCSDFAIVDVQTGKVYYNDMMNSGYFDYRPDSRLFVLGEIDSLGWYPTKSTLSDAPSYYLWENNRMINLWTEPDFR